MAVGDGRIEAVGSEAEVAGLRGPRTEILGGPQAAILPGFIDAHLHFLALARRAAEVDCSEVRSIAGIIERLAEAARARPPGAWIRAFGYDEFFLEEKRPPSVAELDRALPAHPVRLLHRTGHAAVLNGMALRLVGLRANGVIHEPGPKLSGKIPGIDPADLASLASVASQSLLASGITTFHDPTPDPDGVGARTLRRLVESGAIQPRVRVYGSEERFSAQPSPLDDRFQARGVKIVVTEESDGEEIAGQVAVADRSGAQVAIHAVEEGPLVTAIDALRRLGRSRVAAKRHRVEHATLCPPALRRELAACGATVVTHPTFLPRFGEKYRSELPSEQWPWLYPLRSLLECGVPIAFGSDAPIVPPRPLENIQAAVVREPDGSSEAVSVDEALRLHTTGGARAAAEEERLGSLERGRLADAVVLDEDPAEVPAAAISSIQVRATVIGGRVAWRRR